MSRRSQWFLLLGVSGLLHVALLVALSRSPSARVPHPEPSQVIELEIVSRDTRPTPPASREDPPAPRTPACLTERDASAHARKKDEAPALARAPATAGSAPSEPVAEAPEAPPPAQQPDAPLASSSPRLDPPGLLGGGLLKGGPPSTGRTLRNVPGSEPDPQALLAREGEEARQRVDGWARDAAASSRATGATPPYFAKLRQGFAERLVDPPPPDTDVLVRRLKREQLEAMERFGKTGTPFVPQPRDVRRETSDRLRAAVEAGRAANVYMADVTTPILALVAIVEVRQARDGSLIDLQVLEGSGDPKFDRWAVSHLRDALASAEAPADGGVGLREDGMRTRWRLEEYLGNPHVRVHLISIY